jgi:glycosyltransferase involved in cell wall biosynthesis
MLTPDEGYLDRRIAQEAGSLAAAGWSVDIYSAVDPDLRWEEALPDGVQLIRATAPPRTTPPGFSILRRAKRRAERLIPAIAAVIESAQYRVRDVAGEITSSQRGRLSGLGPYSLVVAHDIPVLPLAAELRRAWGAHLICDVHELFPEQTLWIKSRAGRSYWRALEDRGFPLCDALMAVNEGVAAYVRQRAPDRLVVTVQNTVPFVNRDRLVPIDVRPLYDVPAGRKVMVWAGTLRPETNLTTVIRGFLSARLDGWVLAILGDGPLRRELQDFVTRANAGDTVFVGRRVAQGELIRVLASAQIGILSYQADSLNLEVATPNKLYEYIQARLPIATSPLPQVARVITEYKNGQLIDFATPDSAAVGLRRFASEHAAISAEALEAAANDLSWERDAGRMLSLVRQLYSDSDV